MLNFFGDSSNDLELVQQFYTVSNAVFESDNGETSSPYYKLLEPTRHTGWGVELNPLSCNLVITHRFVGSDDYMPITPEEKIIEVDYDDKFVVIKIESTTESKFEYTILMDCTSQHFSIVPFLNNIMNTMFESMKVEIEK